MSQSKFGLGVVVGAAGMLSLALTWNAGVAGSAPPSSDEGNANAPTKRVAVTVAKDRAKLMHTIYSATLDTMHHHYFRREHAVLPARALEDVFKEIDRETQIQSRWIAVNTPAMSINHEPATEFEKKAAAEIAAGKAEFEIIENGYYRRAGAIPLGSSCVGCHTKFGATASKTPRFAGLVISIPVQE